jgi:peptide/nickel transport system permease protein
MLSYIVRRCFYMLFLLIIASIVTFVIIQLPPGDYLTTLVINLEERGLKLQEGQIAALREEYGLNLTIYEQYFKWVTNMLRGDFGRSFQYEAPVSKLIGERLLLTITMSLLTLIFVYLIAVPIGIYSATHQYSLTDYAFTFLGFIGLATPNFLLALILMFLFYKYLNMSVGGLFSPEFQIAGWSIAKVWDMLKHLPIPIFVIGTAGTAGLIRVLRSCLLDELRKQYVVTARSKGLTERRILLKYPVRVAVNPMVSNIGGILPDLVSGATITSIVLSLPTTGPLLFGALMNEDMYLAGSFIMFLTSLSLIGVLISDMLLVVVDPRIRFERKR